MTELENKFPKIQFIRKTETVSTNSDARELCRTLDCPTVVIADRQTGGRGRQGKTFHSPDGGLYMTVALPCGLPISECIGVTSSAAVCVCRAIENLTGTDCGIKWVNDVYLKGSKLCGILVESLNDYEKMVSESLIIGIGVNLTESPVITDSSVKAISLLEAGYAVTRDELCGEILAEILTLVENRYDFSLYLEEYRRRSVVIGREVAFLKNGVTYSGTAENITSSGALTVLCGNDKMTLDSGEISLRIK